MKLKILLWIIIFASFSRLGMSQDIFIQESENNDLYISNIELTSSKKIFSLDKLSLGIMGGANFSMVIPLSRSSIFSGQTPDDFKKDYNFFIENLGMQMGFIMMYDINKIIKLSIQPSSNDYSYKYSNAYQWTGNTNLLYETQNTQKLRFFEVPIIVGFYMSYKTWQPYFQGGIYYGRLINGVTDISVVETSSNLAGSSQSLSYSTSANSTDLYQKNHYGILAGAGISYLFGRSKIGIEANYRLLLTNLNTIETQYMNNQVVSGNYDVPDKFKFSNLAFSINILVPLMCSNNTSRAGSLFCQ